MSRLRIIDEIPEFVAIADPDELSLAQMSPKPDVKNLVPDARDGLTRKERIVLYVLNETQRERGGRNVPTAMLWGRVCEYFYISPEELSEMLARLGARK